MANIWRKETVNPSCSPTWFKKNRGRKPIDFIKVGIYGPSPVGASKTPKYKQRPKKK